MLLLGTMHFLSSDEYHGSVFHVLEVGHARVLGLLPLHGHGDELHEFGVARRLLAPQRLQQIELGVAEQADLKSRVTTGARSFKHF